MWQVTSFQSYVKLRFSMYNVELAERFLRKLDVVGGLLVSL